MREATFELGRLGCAWLGGIAWVGRLTLFIYMGCVTDRVGGDWPAYDAEGLKRSSQHQRSGAFTTHLHRHPGQAQREPGQQLKVSRNSLSAQAHSRLIPRSRRASEACVSKGEAWEFPCYGLMVRRDAKKPRPHGSRRSAAPIPHHEERGSARRHLTSRRESLKPTQTVSRNTVRTSTLAPHPEEQASKQSLRLEGRGLGVSMLRPHGSTRSKKASASWVRDDRLRRSLTMRRASRFADISLHDERVSNPHKQSLATLSPHKHTPSSSRGAGEQAKPASRGTRPGSFHATAS
jgi:hypothetical protein